jgi:hypothetical protein
MRSVHDLILSYLLVEERLINATRFIATETVHPCVSSRIYSTQDVFVWVYRHIYIYVCVYMCAYIFWVAVPKNMAVFSPPLVDQNYCY